MNYEQFLKIKRIITGDKDQEILIDMLSACMGEIGKMNKNTLKLHVKQGLKDALEKRKTKFKNIENITKEEKDKFIHEVIINSVKRAKLVDSVDKIIPECNKVYNDWKKMYRPEEL